jgi:hypothetical protein
VGALRECLEEILRAAGEPKVWERIIYGLACGRVESCPFSQTMVDQGRASLKAWLATNGVDIKSDKQDVPQEVEVRLFQAALRAMDDPDAAAMDSYAVGVRIGVSTGLPRTPAVFEEKTKWRLPWEDDGVKEVWSQNYKSATDNKEIFHKKVEEEKRKGRMLEMTYEEAKKRFKDRLAVASLGLVQEGGEKWRLVHDGTRVVKVNNRIKQRDKVNGPLVYDVARLMDEVRREGGSHFSLVWDFESAHRIVKVHEKDWGLQACIEGAEVPETIGPGELILVNTCGTYGIGSAAYWWGRLGAAVQRSIHYLLGAPLATWLALFADDALMIARGQGFRQAIPLALFWVCILGVPVKWKKCRGGFEFQWIGYWLDFTRFEVGISEARREWVVRWLGQLLEKGGVLIGEFESGLGRLAFVCGAIVFDRPFLAPLYSWKSAARRGAYLMFPPFIKTILTFLRDRMKGRRAVKVSLHQQVGGGALEIFRADAKAEGDDVCIGGWEVRSLEGEVVDTMGSRWFALRLDRKNAPWAFGRGEPYRTIASLEMLATLISVMLFIPGRTGGGGSGVVSAGGTTDNKGNTFVVSKLMTTKFPLLAMVAELATIMEDRCLVMDLNWAPRDQNEEADALSNFDFGRFDVSRRIPVVLEELKFNVLHVLLRDGEAFYRDLQKEKELEAERKIVAVETIAPRRGKKVTLKARDPW